MCWMYLRKRASERDSTSGLHYRYLGRYSCRVESAGCLVIGLRAGSPIVGSVVRSRRVHSPLVKEDGRARCSIDLLFTAIQSPLYLCASTTQTTERVLGLV